MSFLKPARARLGCAAAAAPCKKLSAAGPISRQCRIPAVSPGGRVGTRTAPPPQGGRGAV